jgi:hypothetical protein
VPAGGVVEGVLSVNWRYVEFFTLMMYAVLVDTFFIEMTSAGPLQAAAPPEAAVVLCEIA